MTLTETAFRFRPVVGMVLVALMVFGVVSYGTLPAREDPKLTIRESVIVTDHPGLSAGRVERLITRTLEEAVRRVPEIEEIHSMSMPGRSIIHAEVYERFTKLDQIWDDLRDKVVDARAGLPEGTRDPVVNTDYGDVAVVTAALIAEDFPWRDRLDMAEHVRDRLYAVPGTKRVDLLGAQSERIFIETRNARLAELGLSPESLAAMLRDQNVLTTGGVVDTGARGFMVEPTGSFDSVDEIAEALVTLPDGQGVMPLRDIATVRRATVDPPHQPAYVNGRPAIVFAISMLDDRRVLDYGPAVRQALREIEASLPVGYDLEIITFQADQVAHAVYGVTANVLQTLAIVLVVVILFLGVRTGLIVGSIVPAVMLVTLAIMGIFEITLQRASLATLVIALGLLVDNGIVIAEDFKRRLEDGCSRDEALRRSGRELAVPLLISTLTTILVFVPLMMAEHRAGEYTRSISLVILISLMTSWVLAMTVTPALCHRFVTVPAPGARDGNGNGNGRRGLSDRAFRWMTGGYALILRGLLRVRWGVLVLMLTLLAAAVAGIAHAPKRFFPSSDRSQVLVYIDLPAGVTSRTTDASVRRLSDIIATPDRVRNIDSVVAYVGNGGPRFVLALTPVDPAPNRAFMVVNVTAFEHVDQVIRDLRALFRDEAPDLSARVARMFLGPSDSSVLQVQVKGPDPRVLFATGRRIEDALRAIPGVIDLHSDWENRVPKVVVAVDQARARRAGVTSADIAGALDRAFDGATVSAFREDDDIFPIVTRAVGAERGSLARIGGLSLHARATGDTIPLMQVADVMLVNDEARIAREDLQRTLTVEARHLHKTAEDMAPMVAPALAALEAGLPPGHAIEFDGVVTDSGEARAALRANVPLCLTLIVVLLVAQFNSYRRPAIIVATMPLLLIGASAGLVLMGATFGFMVILGLFSLAGILINNAIVLIDRIDIERAEPGADAFEAIVTASVRRLRPILMSTITTVLGLMPLIVTRDPLFHGMASVIAFGLLLGTVLTLGVVPVLYSLMFGIRPPRRAPSPAPVTGIGTLAADQGKASS
ncbi:efflux RND transporter permease subunit [Roseospira visakhapatnamensis]|uniref:Multidrug efflux pump subunit AcrB n=1 Tax=Roseospira visakhapatnamensis TaxID=390880 RepID=A0A7W6REJ0_9PROT|nr:efflux RND transporter permease subunit [Roseospira visakhapatnamensis]MBB4267086.1 multidrug efflux pump subunit AcrB [Roseospira visakhapatnamensis]